jgi:hypothetical protein
VGDTVVPKSDDTTSVGEYREPLENPCGGCPHRRHLVLLKSERGNDYGVVQTLWLLYVDRSMGLLNKGMQPVKGALKIYEWLNGTDKQLEAASRAIGLIDLIPQNRKQFLASVTMSDLTDLIMLLVRNLYGKIQEREPLPTVILTLVTVPGLCLTHGHQCAGSYSDSNHERHIVHRREIMPRSQH